ncbi:hypothetical protein [Gemmobacter serpentinus]|uniref:hypothetical protein n=1 Tax=Gemmobacter serpentinus TaxID=2652247 RepID=UPI00124C6EE7|nr:hypothetical protein [Gemmobacter serpentinus]
MNKPLHSTSVAHLPAMLVGPRETEISRAFTMLLPVLTAYIRAERELEDVGFSLDPAYSAWHHDSDAAQDRLSDLVRALRSAPASSPLDAPLRRVALVIHKMRCDPEKARVLHETMDAKFEARFQVSGSSPTAKHRQMLLAFCRPILAQFAALPLFDAGPGDDADMVALT